MTKAEIDHMAQTAAKKYLDAIVAETGVIFSTLEYMLAFTKMQGLFLDGLQKGTEVTMQLMRGGEKKDV